MLKEQEWQSTVSVRVLYPRQQGLDLDPMLRINTEVFIADLSLSTCYVPGTVLINEVSRTDLVNPHNTWPVDTTSERSQERTPGVPNSVSVSYLLHCPTQGWALRPRQTLVSTEVSAAILTQSECACESQEPALPPGLLYLRHCPNATTSFLGHTTPLSHSLVLSFTLTHS